MSPLRRQPPLAQQDEAETLPQVFRLDEETAALPDARPRRSGRQRAAAPPAVAAPASPLKAALDEAAPDALPSTDETSAAAIPPQGVTLSDVRPTKRGRLALFYEDDAGEHFLYSVDEETAARGHVKPGLRLDAAALQALQDESDLRRAKDAALAALARRAHGAQELYRKLCRRFEADTAAAAVAEMQRLSLLDDAAFAAARAEGLARRGKSRRQIAADLAALGIGRDARETALATLPQQEDDTLQQLIRRQYAAKLAAGKRDAVAAALVRRGFSPGAVRRALAAAQSDADKMPDADDSYPVLYDE